MRRLAEPFSGAGPAIVGDILAECAAGYRDGEKRKRVLSYRKAVEDASAEYCDGMPCNIDAVNETACKHGECPELDGLYARKFVPQGGHGRRYYDSIINSGIESGKCPVCGINDISQLDHYLPKSRYPLLSVTPANLVPLCSTCNGFEAKGSHVPESYEDCLYHPYFEDPPSCIWLRAEIDYSNGPCVTYEVESLDDDVLYCRLSRFLDVYGLGSRYGGVAVGFLDSMRGTFGDFVSMGGVDELKDHLARMIRSAEASDRNGMPAALWRAALRQIDETAQWASLGV